MNTASIFESRFTLRWKRFVQKPIGPATSGDVREWFYALQTLSDRILWDQDYLTADVFMDLDPDDTKDVRQRTGIDQEYVTAIAPDPSESDRLLLLKRLRELYVEIEEF